MGVGRIYSIQGGGGQKEGKGYFQNSGGTWLKGGVKKFRVRWWVWTLDEAMHTYNYITLFTCVITAIIKLSLLDL